MDAGADRADHHISGRQRAFQRGCDLVSDHPHPAAGALHVPAAAAVRDCRGSFLGCTARLLGEPLLL